MDCTQRDTLIIRADAGTEMGTGHLMRCLALAQAWQDADGSAVFVTACRNEQLLDRLRGEGFALHLLDSPHPDPDDRDQTRTILESYPGAWLVLDGYHFDETYQQSIKQAGHRLLVLDDMAHLKHYYADIMLNQNLHAEQLHYSCEPYTQLLLGTRYVLLRREFLAWKNWKREIPELAKRVLVTLGGGDPENHTLKVIEALQEVDIPGLETTVVIGASNPHTEVLQAAVTTSRIPIRLLHSAQNMPELMAWADVAVSAAGSTVWELMFMGVPSLLLIIADNQHLGVPLLKRSAKTIDISHSWNGAAFLDDLAALLKHPPVRQQVCAFGRTSVDGAGAARTAAAIRAYSSPLLKDTQGR